ncbi:phosphogluconate dehydratase [Acanthopleuribacter pedis]|uniref:Phosphogluconate dehydratase n=1 Tax=Acanthopleuribacter pedis TaxID=442870 RepID=A0A8J7Q6D4_9BACT|nr:phosphogluconate dehydratase [Acanthopleuribacter pedis]MBO1317524.1 phosphogluconate dehydratase [Acanthopleuribacter pedis]
MSLHPVVHDVTERIKKRSATTRAAYVARMEKALGEGPHRNVLSCGNLAHGFAACNLTDKTALRGNQRANIAIVSAYNDMLSAHEPLQTYPEIIKQAARDAGAVAQFAGGVPAMCDGVTQGQPGMELSLFSRDVIAMATAVALTHNMFDAALCLGVCDKIVPGMLMGALAFGHLPCIFVPAGPMPSGLPNKKKAEVRQLFAQGKVDREALLDAESKSYHSPGTCTFYGTANSNQMLMEIMGLHLPGTAFVNPGTELRHKLTAATAERAAAIAALGETPMPLYKVIDERAIVNGVVGLLASGGSTNHTIHLIAIAQAAGVQLNWDDFSELSAVTPSLTRIYPNGQADVNHFHAAGGMSFLIRELLGAGLVHGDVNTVAAHLGEGLHAYTKEPFLDGDSLTWREGVTESGDPEILASVAKPFSPNGGVVVLRGNMGRGVIKVSAVKPEHRVVEAPAVVFNDQNELLAAFQAGELEKDCVAVVRFQGPKANGMPELHKLTPSLGVMQDKGYKVALVTDGRMSGASGKVPAAIHVTPECLDGGPLAKVRDGDIVRVDAEQGVLEAKVAPEEWARRETPQPDLTEVHHGLGRELFAPFRAAVNGAEAGAGVFSA